MDVSSFPVPGTLLVAVLLYGGASYLAGQTILGPRLVEQAGWQESCEAGLIAAAAPVPQRAPQVQELRCSTTLGRLGREFGALCDGFGDPDFNAQPRRMEEEALRRQQELEARRQAEAAVDAVGQCSCAASVFVSDQGFGLAVSAGTARLIEMHPVANLQSSLEQSLASPVCQAVGSRS